METTQLWLCLHYSEHGGSVGGAVVHLVVWSERARSEKSLFGEFSQQVWAQSLKANTLTTLTLAVFFSVICIFFTLITSCDDG